MKPLNAMFAAVFLALMCARTHAGDWPRFRGPDGMGISDEKNLPVKWSESENVKWKLAVHGKAWSSPVIMGNQIWLSSATKDGRELFAICVDKTTGKIIHDLKLFDIAKPQYCIEFNSYASPTPVIEAGKVYITFGAPGTACLDTQTAKVLWTRTDIECNHYRGAGSSPAVFGDLLIMHFDGSDHQFIMALDKNTGKTVWRKDRSVDYQDLLPDGKIKDTGDWRKAFSTPLVKEIDGRPTLLSLGSKAFYAYDPLTGDELWRTEERGGHSGSSTPVFGSGLIYTVTGHPAQLFAIRPGGKGVVTDTHIVWKAKRNIPTRPSVLVSDDLLYMVDDGGIASCLDAKTGKDVWRQRIAGNYSASPILAEGRIYFFSEDGKTTVIEAGREFKLLAENKLGMDEKDGFMATPAISDGAFYLRTKLGLYRVEKGN